jgi:hypothetical protein
MDRNSKIAKNVPKMFQDSRCLTETPRFLDEIPRFPIDRNSKISEIPKPKLDSESGSIFPLLLLPTSDEYLNLDSRSTEILVRNMQNPQFIPFFQERVRNTLKPCEVIYRL